MTLQVLLPPRNSVGIEEDDSCPITSSALERRSSESIRELAVGICDETSKDGVYLKSWKEFAEWLTQRYTHLLSLNLSGNQLTSDHLPVLSDVLNQQHCLQTLDLSKNPTLPIVTELFPHTSCLETVRLTQTKLSSTSVLVSLLRQQVKHLHLGHNQLGTRVMKKLAEELQRNTSLEVLTLEHNQIGSRGAELLLAALAKNRESALVHLDFEHNNIRRLQDTLFYLQTLSTLCLGNNPTNGKTPWGLLQYNTGLTELQLKDNDLHTWLPTLAEGLQGNAHLRILQLSWNQLNCDDAKCLSQALKRNSNLRKLDLSHNCIQPDGASCLMDMLLYNMSMAELDLRYNPTDEADLDEVPKRAGVLVHCHHDSSSSEEASEEAQESSATTRDQQTEESSSKQHSSDSMPRQEGTIHESQLRTASRYPSSNPPATTSTAQVTPERDYETLALDSPLDGRQTHSRTAVEYATSRNTSYTSVAPTSKTAKRWFPKDAPLLSVVLDDVDDIEDLTSDLLDEQPNIKFACLGGDQLTGHGFYRFCNLWLQHQTSLVRLYIQPANLQCMPSPLFLNTCLQVLSLTDCQLTCVRVLVDAMQRSKNLQSLTLDRNALGNESLQLLSPFLHNHVLKSLRLCYNRISDVACLEGHTLTELELTHNRIADRGALDLCKTFLREPECLETLGLEGNPITDKGVAALRAFAPPS